MNDVVTGLLLDLDGTLLDHRAAAAGAVAEWSRSIPGWSGDEREAVRLWGELETQWYPVFTRGECTFEEQRRRRVRGFHRSLANLDDAAADAVFAGYLAGYQARWVAAPGAAELIDRALDAGLSVGVLTNGEEQQQRHKLERIGLARPELHLFASSALGVAKPDVRAFTLACAGLGTRPGETVMVGDDLATDILGARAAGLAAFHLSRDAAATEATVCSLAEVRTLLLG